MQFTRIILSLPGRFVADSCKALARSDINLATEYPGTIDTFEFIAYHQRMNRAALLGRAARP
jgi:hypothetical protein